MRLAGGALAFLPLLVLLSTVTAAAAPPRLAIQTGHVGAVVEVAWSSDGRLLASLGGSSHDASVKVWDPSSGRLLASIRPAPLAGMRWSPDGTRIALWENGGTIHVWNARRGADDVTIDAGASVREVAWAPDGARLAVALAKSCLLVDARTGERTATLDGVTAPLRFSADGSRLFAGGVLWEGDGRSALARLDGFQPGFLRIDPTAWSRDGRLIASAAARTLRLWSGAGALLQEIPSSARLTDVAWSPDGSMLAVSSMRVTIYRVDVSRATVLEPLAEATGPESWIGSLAWSPDGRFLAAGSAEGALTIWTADGFGVVSKVKAHAKGIDSIAWSPASGVVATGGADADVKAWSSGGRLVSTMTAHTRPLLAVDWSADSRFVAAGADDGPVRVWEVESGQIIAALEGQKARDRLLEEMWKVPALAQILVKPTAVHEVRGLQWFPSGDRLAVLATNGAASLEVWQPLQGRLVTTIEVPVHGASSFAWSPDGSRFAVGAATQGRGTRATRIFDSTGTESGALDEQTGEGTLGSQSLSWSPDGTMLARSGSDLASLVADFRASQEVGKGASGCCVAFSPDGALLAAPGALWDMRTRSLAASLPQVAAAAVAWSPDGTRLAIAAGREVLVYDVAARSTLTRLSGHDADVTDVAWSGDGLHLVTSSGDGSLRLWTGGGTFLATMLVLDEGRDWLVTTPDGLFDGSPGAWKLVGWHADPDDFLRVDPVEIFFREYFHPGLLPDLLRGRRPRAPVAIDRTDRRQPVVSFVSPSAAAASSARLLHVVLEVTEAPRDPAHPSGGGGARDVRLFRNGSLVAHWSGDVLNGKKSARLEADVAVVAGENRLTAWAFNSSNIKSADAETVVLGAPQLARRGAVRILAVGIDRYANSDFDLRFARADAAAFGAELQGRQRALGAEEVELITLFDDRATRTAILDAVRAAGAASAPEDALVVFFAGHGVASGARFHLLPHDFGYAGAREELDGSSFAATAGRTITDVDLESALRDAGAERILLVIDACNSGQALESEERRRGPMNSKGLAQLAWEKGMNVVTAAQGYQAALETEQLGHGFLTFVLVEEGLKRGAADVTPRDGALLVREWLDYAALRVPRLQETAMAAAREQGREVAFVDGEQVVRDLARRSLQRPRVFYRREPERQPFVIARP